MHRHGTEAKEPRHALQTSSAVIVGQVLGMQRRKVPAGVLTAASLSITHNHTCKSSSQASCHQVGQVLGTQRRQVPAGVLTGAALYMR